MSSHRQPLFPFVHLFLFLMLMMFVTKSQGQDQGQSGQPLVTFSYLFRSLYSFGDSFVDPGNNDYIQTMAKSNFPPYGRDFVNETPTGRFSNGRLFPDFLAYYIGVEKYQQPYLDPKLNLKETFTAVSFASATSGYDPLTANKTKAIPMSEQLENFKQYKAKLQKNVGKKRADYQIKKALFYVNAGSDDFAFSYFGDGVGGSTRQQQYKLRDYEKFLVQLMLQFIRGLYDQGARKIAVNGLPPLGCIPIGITRMPLRNSQVESRNQRNCIDKLNSVSKEFNTLLQEALEDLQMSLSKFGTKIAYIDFEESLLNVIQNPDEYGFTEVNKGCCGTGLYEIGTLCNQTSPVCVDDSEYVFWDGAHPTEKTYDIIFKNNLETIDQMIIG